MVASAVPLAVGIGPAVVATISSKDEEVSQ
jgi:hypothetical protein